MNAEQTRALTELDDTMAARAEILRELHRLEKIRDRRIMRAVAVGVDRVLVAKHADLSRQRVGQIATGVDKGAGKSQVAALAKVHAPRDGEGVRARLAALDGTP